MARNRDLLGLQPKTRPAGTGMGGTELVPAVHEVHLRQRRDDDILKDMAQELFYTFRCIWWSYFFYRLYGDSYDEFLVAILPCFHCLPHRFPILFCYCCVFNTEFLQDHLQNQEALEVHS